MIVSPLIFRTVPQFFSFMLCHLNDVDEVLEGQIFLVHLLTMLEILLSSQFYRSVLKQLNGKF